VPRAPRHAPKESGNDVPAPVGDQLPDAGAAQALRLGAFASGFGVRKGRQQLEPATAAVGVQPLWGRGHATEVAERDNIRQGQLRCATRTARFVNGKRVQSWTFTTSANRWS
jgi:hypothetical protein